MHADAYKVISEEVRLQFGDDAPDVVLREGVSYDGDQVINVLLVAKSPAAGRLDPDKYLTTMSNARHRLLDLEETAFPIFYYVSSPEEVRL